MNCATFWSRASEHPFPPCTSRLHCPILPVSLCIEAEPTGSPRGRTAADDTASNDGTWRSDSPNSKTWDSLQSELTVFARDEVENHEPSLEFEDPIDQPPGVECREGNRDTTGGPRYKKARVKETRRVHFSPIVFFESWEERLQDDSTEHHESGCLPHREACGRLNNSSKLATFSTFPLRLSTPRWGPSSNNYEEDYMNPGSSDDSSELEIQPLVRNLSISPKLKLSEKPPEPPAAANQAEPNERMHPPQSTSCTPRLCNIEDQAEGLRIATNLGEIPLHLASPTTTSSVKKDSVEGRGIWDTSIEQKPSFPLLQRYLSPTDIHVRTSLRNCSNLLQPELEPNHPSTTISRNLGKPGDPSRSVQISAAHPIDKVGSSIESVGDPPESPSRYDLGEYPWFDSQGTKNASRVTYKQQKDDRLTDDLSTPEGAAWPTEIGNCRKGLNKPSKSSYWFNVPYSTDADLPAYLLRSRGESPDSEPVLDIVSPRSMTGLGGGNKASKSSYWFDVPYYKTDAKLPAHLLPRTSATPNSEPVEHDVRSTGSRLPRLSGGNKASKSSYWFDVPYSAVANQRAYLLQTTGISPDSEPVVQVRSTRSTLGLTGSYKASKSSFWFDVPYSTDADLPAYLLHRRIATQNPESVVDVDSTTGSLGVSGGADTVETAQLRKDATVPPQTLDAAQQEGSQVADVFTTPPTGKTYPGEFCPSFMLCPGDIMMTRNLREEENKIGGHVTVFPGPSYFEEKGIAAADSSVYYQFTCFDMVLRLGQFDKSHDDWNWVPSPSFSLFMYAPLEQRQSASWWLVDSKPSVALPAPDQHLDVAADPMSLNSRLQLSPRNTDLVISTIPDPGLACKKRWRAQWGSPLFFPLTQDVLVRACYGHYSSDPKPKTNSTWATVELYSYCGDSLATWRFLGRDSRCYGPPSGKR